MVNDGKFICKRFFSNFEKLKREVESEEAFFFNDDGVYCQVGTSIFDRWEQVTLIDPEWCERGVPRCLHAIEATRVHQTRSWWFDFRLWGRSGRVEIHSRSAQGQGHRRRRKTRAPP